MASKQQIQLIHIAKAQLGLDDDLYRQLLMDIGGAPSSKELTFAKADAVLEHLKSKGFKAIPKGRLSPKSGTAAVGAVDKIRAIWITMSKQGFVRDGSETALDKWVCSVTQVRHVGWLKQRSAAQALEALKKWHTRELERALGARWGFFPESRLYLTLDDYRRQGRPTHGGRWYEALCDLYKKYGVAK
ncbi:regulatory protein GemA [Gallaecimonas kandeliae]|uniref:gp16 family protein n=1 Tax=Gallaecimonas kandeliae TaxID=3029055 RepID=UPI002648870D|nr:regulatory protein GemA [Gallaecimonas kandeliae]WKE65037.1 regulatory protein GemA [Gallaecimonas kandeliae]